MHFIGVKKGTAKEGGGGEDNHTERKYFRKSFKSTRDAFLDAPKAQGNF